MPTSLLSLPAVTFALDYFRFCRFASILENNGNTESKVLEVFLLMCLNSICVSAKWISGSQNCSDSGQYGLMFQSATIWESDQFIADFQPGHLGAVSP